MTELQNQVKNLRKGLVLSAGLTNVPSLFLSPSDAAKIDISSIFASAEQSLHVLSQYDDRFHTFTMSSNVLHLSSVSMQRELKTREENNKIDQQLNDLLKLLAIYANERDTHKILEYLIRRFRIHEMNTVAFIQAFIHIHDSTIFARIVQLCVIEGTVWDFLSGVKSSGIPTARSNIVKRCSKDATLLKILCDHCRSSIKLLHGQNQLAIQGVERILSFFVAVVIELIESTGVLEDHIRILYSFILDGLSATSSSSTASFVLTLIPFRKSSCMIIAELCRKVALGDSFLRSIIKGLVTAFTTSSVNTSSDAEDITFALCIVLIFQKTVVEYTSLSQLFEQPHVFIRVLESLAEQFNISEAVQTVLSSLVIALSSQTTSHGLITTVSQQILSSKLATDAIVQSYLAQLLRVPEVSNNLRGAVIPILCLVSQRFPEAFDSSLQTAYKTMPGSETTLQSLLQEAFVDAAYHIPANAGGGAGGAGVSLLLALRNSSEHIRVRAVHSFVTQIPLESPSTPDLVSICEAMCSVLEEGYVGTAQHAWTPAVLTRVAQHTPPYRVLSIMDSAWRAWVARMTLRGDGASALVESILHCIADPGVAAALTSDAAVLPSGETGRLWLLRKICTTAQGGLMNAESHAETAVTAAKSLKAVFPLFEPITDSLVKKTPLDQVIPLCFVKLAVTNLESFENYLVALASDTAADLSTQLTTARLLNTILERVQSTGQAVAVVLKYQVPFLVRLVVLCDEEQVEELHEYVDAAIAALPRTQPASAPSLSGFFSGLRLSPSDLDKAEVMLLIALLETPHTALTESVSVLLETHFQPRVEVVLLRLALADEALVSEGVKVAALCTLGSFVASISESASVASFVTSTLQVDIAYSLLACIPLILSCCRDPRELVRSSALEIAHSFANLSKKLHIQLPTTSDPSGVFAKKIALSDIVAFMASFSAQNFGKSMDIEAVSPFSHQGVLSNAQLSLMKAILIESVKMFTTSFVKVSADLLRVLNKRMTLVEGWTVFESICVRTGAVAGVVNEDLLETLFACLGSIEELDQETLVHITAFLVNLVDQRSTPDYSYQTLDIRRRLLALYANSWAGYTPSTQRGMVFDALVRLQTRSPGQRDVVAALNEAVIDFKLVSAALLDGLASFMETIEEKRQQQRATMQEAQTDGEEDEVTEDAESVVAGPLQSLAAVLEGLIEQFRKSKLAVNGPYFSNALVRLFDVLKAINTSIPQAVLSVEFTKTLLLEMIAICLDNGGADAMNHAPTASVSKAKKSKKEKLSGADETAGVSDVSVSARTLSDVNTLFTALQSSRTASLQLTALSALEKLLSRAPDIIDKCIYSLGKLLTKTASDTVFSKEGRSEKEGLIEDILSKLCRIMQSAENAFLPQMVLQPLCFHFSGVNSFRRSYLIKASVDLLGESCLPACVSVLLTHSLVSYDPEEIQKPTQETAGDTSVYILLSRSAQRKAHRQLKSSRPEDIFKLAQDFPLKQAGGASQVSMLVVLLRVAQELHTSLCGSASDDSQPAVVSNTITSGTMSVDVSGLIPYALQVFSELKPSQTPNTKGVCAALLLLHLEYVFEMLENTSFRRVLAYMSEKRDGVKLQALFIEVVEQVLELVALTGDFLHEDNDKNDKTITLHLGTSDITITLGTLSKCVHDWSLNIIKSLQKLLDGPTFIAILQELLEHEQLAIRQNAVQMLSERLSDVKTKEGKPQNASEQALYVDLCARLHTMLQESTAVLKQNEDVEACVKARGFMQSAIICVDVLAKAIGKGAAWADILSETLQELIDIATELSGNTSSDSGDDDLLDVLKLLGSVYLCCGTLCGSMGPRSLSIFPQLMGLMTESMHKQGKSLRQLSRKSVKRNSGLVDNLESRTLVIFLRSIIASTTTVTVELPTFMHPYMHTSIVAMLRCYELSGIADSCALDKDIDRCLGILAAHIPSRLCIPSVLANITALLGQGHNQARRFVEFLTSVWSSIDRASLTSQLSDVSSVVILTLDYHREHSDGTPEAERVDHAAVQSAVEFCLKLTEAELRTFLLKLAEWRDLYEEDASLVTRYARGSIFFQLMAALCQKLRSIFVPLLSYVWSSAVTALEQLGSLRGQGSGSGSKKRKADLADGEASSDSRGIKELLNQSKWVLECIKAACIHDSEGFIDEERFVAMSPRVGDLLAKYALFENTDEYNAYMEHGVIPCVTALATSITKDMLWKPINHKLIQLSKDKKSCVRVTAIKTLHALFQEVGEEYLIMLPECLPALSELLEDNNEDVLTLTVDLVKFIENLSGEKLDQYLQ